MLTAIAGCVVAFVGAIQQANPGEVTTIVKVPWIPAIGANYYLAADGISLVLVVLTGLAAVSGILFSWNIEKRTKEFFAFYLALIGGVYGVFLSFDVLLLFVFYELTIIPKYFLIARWGSTRKEYGAMKLALYSFVGSHLVLIGLIAAWVVAQRPARPRVAGFDRIVESRFSHRVSTLGVSAGVCRLCDSRGHVAVSHLGADRPRRRADRRFDAARRRGDEARRLRLPARGDGDVSRRRADMAVAQSPALAVAGIVYGAGVALVQRDFKFVIGYSSVSHMGFVLLGLATLNTIGLDGAVLQMFSHGIIAGLLFGVVGRMVYDRTHTRDFNDLETMQLGKLIPFAGVTFVIAGIASMGLPGFSGFVAEFQVLMGAWTVFPKLTILSGVGILIGVAYTLRAMQKGFYSDAPPKPVDHDHPLEPISMPERFGAVMLIGASLVIGLFPGLLMNWIEPCFNSPLSMFARLLVKGGSQ